MRLFPAALVFADGEVIYGTGIGKRGVVYGEVVFNTGMTGYQEVLTDPSYAYQIINFTYPHIGNTGIVDDEQESQKVWANGLIVRELSTNFSNSRASGSLQCFLEKYGVVGIEHIDTRYVTQKVRDNGNIYACIASKNNVDLGIVKEKLSRLSHKYTYNAGVKKITVLNGNFERNVAVIDFGVKDSITKLLQQCNFNVTLFPRNTTFDEVMSYKPHMILLSNGPGDPSLYVKEISLIKQFIEHRVPIGGICLGFQLIAIALGGQTEKMLFGHHGLNHPVKDLRSGRVFITTQNHNFTVNPSSISDKLEITHISLLDGTLQGFKHRELPIFALQGHPEAGPGTSDARMILKRFIDELVQ